MSDMMTFPDTWEDFEKSYGFTDNEEVYTNGARLIPSFRVKQWLDNLPSEQPERLTDDDFETIRIHLNAFKENLCNQRRWKEAEEYQRIIDRFMAFASTQPRRGKWIDYSDEGYVECPFCHSATNCDGNKDELHYCFSCGADMRSEAREYLEYGKLIAKGIEQGLRGDSDEN